MNHLAEALQALTDPAWRPSPAWLAARGAGTDPLFDAWQSSVDVRAMLRVLQLLSHVQSQRGCFVVAAPPAGRDQPPLAPDWRDATGDVFRVRFMTSDGGHIEFEGDGEIADEVRARFPVVTIADVLGERSRTF